jgi:cytochrome bd-type quinol oxidase subunit 2
MAGLLAAFLPLADAASEGKKIIYAMLVVGLVFVAVVVLGETWKYFTYHRRPH